MAQSGHFAAEFQCLLSGVKRTSASLYNLIEVNCEVPGQFYFEARIIGFTLGEPNKLDVIGLVLQIGLSGVQYSC